MQTDGGMDRRKWTGGNKQGDEEGEWTYLDSRGETMIDYEIVNEEVWESVEEFRIGERAESDHLEMASRKRRRGMKIVICITYNVQSHTFFHKLQFG
jgi:hypothetical protein